MKTAPLPIAPLLVVDRLGLPAGSVFRGQSDNSYEMGSFWISRILNQ